MDVYMSYDCIDNNGLSSRNSGTFPIYYQDSYPFWTNTSMFDEMADCSDVDVLYAEIKSFEPENKDGNMLIQ